MKAKELIEILSEHPDEEVLIGNSWSGYFIVDKVLRSKKFYCKSNNQYKNEIITRRGSMKIAVDYKVGQTFIDSYFKEYKVVNVSVI